jgi:hypothetical protein
MSSFMAGMLRAAFKMLSTCQLVLRWLLSTMMAILS